MRKGIEKNIWYCMAGKVENKKWEEYENENYYFLWWSDKGVTPPRVLSYWKSKLCKKREINIWNYHSLDYLQCQPAWLTAYAQSYQVTHDRTEISCTASTSHCLIQSLRKVFYSFVWDNVRYLQCTIFPSCHVMAAKYHSLDALWSLVGNRI